MLKVSPYIRLTDMLLLGLAAFIVYGRSIGHSFLNWDDASYVVNNQTVAGFSIEHVREAFSTYFVGNYAPLHIISYMFDYSLWGLSPGGFVFTNICLHACNGILWYRMLFRWYSDRFLAAVAACLFLVHPVQVESVVWVSQRKNLLALFLFLIAWDSYCRYRRAAPGGRGGFYVLSLAAFGLALLTKSVVVIFPVVLICYDLCFEEKQNRLLIIDKIPYILLTASGVILALLSQAQDVTGGRVAYHGGSAWYTFLTMLPVLCRYVSMIVWPVNLSALYSALLHTAPDGTVICAALFLALLAAGGVALYHRDSRSGFWALFFLIGLLPVLQIIPLNTLISDRYLYFPMLGVSALAGVAAFHAVQTAGRRFAVFIKAAVSGLLLCLAVLAFLRTEVWKDSLSLWQDAVAKVPESARAWGNLGNAYEMLDARPEALEAYRRSLELNPDNDQVLYNLGTMYYYAGEYDKARSYYQRLPKGYRPDGIAPLSDQKQSVQ